jgi:hypothetical protein
MDRNLLLGDLLDQFSNYTNGMRLPGNIDLNRRPVVRNPDRSISTVASTSIGTDRGEVLIPMVAADGSRVLSQEEAEEQFFKTGQHLGIFETPEHANTYANSLHEQHARQYAPGDQSTTADILQAQEEESRRRLTHQPQVSNPYMQGIEDMVSRWWEGVQRRASMDMEFKPPDVSDIRGAVDMAANFLPGVALGTKEGKPSGFLSQWEEEERLRRAQALEQVEQSGFAPSRAEQAARRREMIESLPLGDQAIMRGIPPDSPLWEEEFRALQRAAVEREREETARLLEEGRPTQAATYEALRREEQEARQAYVAALGTPEEIPAMERWHALGEQLEAADPEKWAQRYGTGQRLPTLEEQLAAARADLEAADEMTGPSSSWEAIAKRMREATQRVRTLERALGLRPGPTAPSEAEIQAARAIESTARKALEAIRPDFARARWGDPNWETISAEWRRRWDAVEEATRAVRVLKREQQELSLAERTPSITREQAANFGTPDQQAKAELLFKGIAEDPNNFQFGGKPESTKLADLVAHYSRPPKNPLEMGQYDNQIVNTATDGRLLIQDMETPTPHTYGADAQSQGSKQGGGTNMYQAAMSWIANNNKRLKPDPRGISDINKLRKVSNTISNYLRHGKEGYIGLSDATQAQNLRELIVDEKNKVLGGRPDLEGAAQFDGERFVSPSGEVLSDGYLTKLIADKDPHFSMGIGLTTLKRALLTKWAMGATLDEVKAAAKKFKDPVLYSLAGLTVANESAKLGNLLEPEPN